MICQNKQKCFVSVDGKTERLRFIINDPLMQVEAGDPSSSSEPLDSEASKSSPSQADRVSHIEAEHFTRVPLSVGNAKRVVASQFWRGPAMGMI